MFPLGSILCGTLHFLDLVGYLFSHIKEVFSYYVFEYFLRAPFSLSSSEPPIMWMFVHLMLSQRSLRLSSLWFFFFSHSFFYILFCGSDFHIPSSRSLTYSFASWWLGLCSLPVSCLAWWNPALGCEGSMVRLMVTSKRTYTKGQFLDCCCQYSLQQNTADPHLQRTPSSM